MLPLIAARAAAARELSIAVCAAALIAAGYCVPSSSSSSDADKLDAGLVAFFVATKGTDFDGGALFLAAAALRAAMR